MKSLVENQTELFTELMVRQAALESALGKAGILTQKDIADAQLDAMVKIQAVLDSQQNNEL